MKIEWKRNNKNIYLPPQVPVLVDIPTYSYFMISGKGNPNDKFFSDYIGVLYCVQMMYVGNYDSEPESFENMEKFCKGSGLQRLSKQHREIYLSDVRKVAPDKLKTVLRFKVNK